MERFGDPTFARHATAARIGAAMLMRLANADVLPYDYVEYAATMRNYLPPIERALGASATAPLRQALAAFDESARRFSATRDSALRTPVVRAASQAANAELLGVERALTRAEGLASRPWYRNLIYASDVDNGYATMPFPSVNEAIRAGDDRRARDELTDLAARFAAATARLDAARAALAR